MWIGKTFMVAYRHISQPAFQSVTLCISGWQSLSCGTERRICRAILLPSADTGAAKPARARCSRLEVNWADLLWISFLSVPPPSENTRSFYSNTQIDVTPITTLPKAAIKLIILSFHFSIFSSIMFWSVAWLCFNGSANTFYFSYEWIIACSNWCFSVIWNNCEDIFFYCSRSIRCHSRSRNIFQHTFNFLIVIVPAACQTLLFTYSLMFFFFLHILSYCMPITVQEKLWLEGN